MATPQTSTTVTYSGLAALPYSYFKAVDTRDIDSLMSLFSLSATLTIQTDNVTYRGVEEIRSMFTAFLTNSKTLLHEIKSIVVDPVTRRIATEQRYAGELNDGTLNDMYNCNFFDVDEDGKLTRVIIWMSGTNPLK